MKTILCDLDGVVADFFKPLLNDYNRKTGSSFKTDDIADWHFSNFPRPDLIQDIIDKPGLFARLSLLPGAKDGLRELLDIGHDVYIVSAGSREALSEKSYWCRRNLPFMKDRVIFTDGKTPKSLVRGDVLIDDGPHNLIGAKERGLTTVAAWHRYTEPARASSDFIVPMAKNPLQAWDAIVKLFEEAAP